MAVRSYLMQVVFVLDITFLPNTSSTVEHVLYFECEKVQDP